MRRKPTPRAQRDRHEGKWSQPDLGATKPARRTRRTPPRKPRASGRKTSARRTSARTGRARPKRRPALRQAA